ncbi:MAG: DUF885 domain-containing protein [Chitinophagaceae bacterium]|nr:DUF885 domain-containing protein [Chitinophagaceae bacterium]
MNRLLYLLLVLSLVTTACNETQQPDMNHDNSDLSGVFARYFDERMKLFPLEATANGINDFNDKLYVEFTDEYVAKLREFYSRHLAALNSYSKDSLSENDKTSYDVFKHELEMSLEGLDHRFTTYIPFQQFWGLPLTLGQMGSGEGNQPFKTGKDYENWLSRAAVFQPWADSAIMYFRKGIASGLVLPEKLVVKMIPQMEAMVTNDPTKSIFYGPITKMPDSLSADDKLRFTEAYKKLITEQIVPSYQKLGTFLKNEYLPKARATSGVAAIPGGNEYYRYISRYWTTTSKSPDEIYATGEQEVKRIRGLMDSVKSSVGFTGSLDSFFVHLRADKKFKPYKSANEVLDAYRAIQSKIEPNLKSMFGKFPKTKFEIRQTEAFRAASASAEYNPGAPDGSRPGIFYIPIVDATQFNVTSGMENLFLHEAIPGHHYQIALQAEDTTLPKFRRFLWYGAYGEGWALYTESLGKELGLYTDPYQYMGALGDEIHRAIRLVVDVGLHTKNMTREQAIKYMMDNEAISEEGATAEIERYMAIPGQALSYKIGALKIRELRDKYQQHLGSKFKLATFHDEFLSYGCVPLDVLEKRMDAWSTLQ